MVPTPGHIFITIVNKVAMVPMATIRKYQEFVFERLEILKRDQASDDEDE